MDVRTPDMNMSIGQVQKQIESRADALVPTIAASGDQGTAQAGTDFSSAFMQAVYSVDGRDQAAAQKMAAVDSGESDDLVGAMLASQDASLAFSMLVQMRNKVVGAVDDLMKLQI
jgi:flagellar hook-basal body complex protein FliE